MKKFLGITLGGLQKKAITLVLMMLLIVIAVAAGISAYQNKMLVGIVEETRSGQQQAISKISERTMDRVLESAMVSSTASEMSWGLEVANRTRSSGLTPATCSSRSDG